MIWRGSGVWKKSDREERDGGAQWHWTGRKRKRRKGGMPSSAHERAEEGAVVVFEGQEWRGA